MAPNIKHTTTLLNDVHSLDDLELIGGQQQQMYFPQQLPKEQNPENPINIAPTTVDLFSADHIIANLIRDSEALVEEEPIINISSGSYWDWPAWPAKEAELAGKFSSSSSSERNDTIIVNSDSYWNWPAWPAKETESLVEEQCPSSSSSSSSSAPSLALPTKQ